MISATSYLPEFSLVMCLISIAAPSRPSQPDGPWLIGLGLKNMPKPPEPEFPSQRPSARGEETDSIGSSVISEGAAVFGVYRNPLGYTFRRRQVLGHTK